MALGSRGRTIALVFGGVLGFSAIAGWVIGGDGEQIDTITAESDGTLPNGGMSSELDGQALPDLELASLDGTRVNMASLGGDGVPMLINLWAESCRACRDEMPEFELAHQELGDSLRIIGLNVEDSASQAGDYADKVGVTYEVLVDPAGLTLNEFKVPALPATLIIGADGVIQHLHLGVLTADRIRTLVPEELGQ
jgi:cytochrome c biogenesis protein CcmG, thiol:disulfide interchange protein DsbE